MARLPVAGVLLAALVVTAGCGGLLSDSISVSASPVSVSDAALDDTGYEHNRTDELTVSRTFSAAGQSKDVAVTNRVAEYHRTVGVDTIAERPVAVFAVLSSPSVSVLGESFNPIGEFGARELAETVTQRMDRVETTRQVGTRNESMLGKTAEVSTFEAAVTTALGVEFDATLHVTKVEHDGDFVVAIAAHPRQLDAEDDVNRLLDGVQHGE